MTIELRKIDRTNPVLRQYFRSGRLLDGVLQRPALTINAAPAKFDLAALSYVIGGVVYATVAQAALVFSAAHVVTDGGWGAIWVLIDAFGAVTTLVPGATQTTAMNYASEALALAALPAIPAGKVAVGTITISLTGATFTCNTTALNAAAVTSANLLGSYQDRRWGATKPGVNFAVLTAQSRARLLGAGTFQAEVVATKQSTAFNQMVTTPQLEVDRRTVANATVTKLRFGPFDYLISGVLYHAEAQKQLAFTAAHPVTADKWGAILLLIDTAGVYSTLIGEVTQTTAQAYTNAAAARAALPAVPSGKHMVGILVIEAKNATWTANTDDIVAASDLENFDLVSSSPDRVLGDVTLAIDAVPEKYKTTVAFDYVLDGVKYSKAAATAIAFTAAHQCTASKYLAILIGINAAGTVSSKVPLRDGRSQTAAQGYDSVDLAVAALPTPDAGVRPIGCIIIGADGTGWVAQTDDMTPGSDLTSVQFRGFTTQQVLTVRGNGIGSTRKNELWPVSGAAFVSNVQTDTDAVSNLKFQRGWESGTLGIFWAATATAVVQSPECTVVQRPWAAGGEATI